MLKLFSALSILLLISCSKISDNAVGTYEGVLSYTRTEDGTVVQTGFDDGVVDVVKLPSGLAVLDLFENDILLNFNNRGIANYERVYTNTIAPGQIQKDVLKVDAKIRDSEMEIKYVETRTYSEGMTNIEERIETFQGILLKKG